MHATAQRVNMPRLIFFLLARTGCHAACGPRGKEMTQQHNANILFSSKRCARQNKEMNEGMERIKFPNWAVAIVCFVL